MTEIASILFDSFDDVRYVAVYIDGRLEMKQRSGIANASAAESDKYEEIIVNPTMLKLLEQRGNIDCGGIEYVVVRYGSFFEFVQPLGRGHISVGVQPDAELGRVVPAIRTKIETWKADLQQNESACVPSSTVV